MTQGRGRGGIGGRFLTEEEKQQQPKVTKELLARVFSYLKPYWKHMLLVMVCIAAASFCSLLPTILTGKIIDEGLIKGDLRALVTYILLSLAVTFGSNLIGVAESYINTWIAQHITYDMRNQMFSHLQKMSQRFFTTNNQGDIITRMTSDIDGVQQVITNTFTSILSNTITLIIAMTAMFRKNWILALIGIVIVPLFTLPTRRAGKTRWKYANESQACNDEINGILNETLSVSGQLLSKLFGKEKYEYDRYEQANGRMIKLNIRERMAGRWFFVILSTFTSIGPMLIYLVGGLLMIRYHHNLTIGDITVLVTLLGRMYMPVNSLLNIQVDWIRSMALFTRIFDYFDIPVEIQNAPDAVTPEHAEGNVVFDHVSFGYEPGRTVLKDISFTLNAGRSIAIVGPSGSGKSTIINLIPRLYDVGEGRVTFDGTDVRKLDLEFLRAQVGVVSQETYLFNGTIRDNLLYARPDATDADMEEALRKANIWDFVQNQPEGLNAMVGNRGLKLSGGEKQRLSIARVLLKDPTVFIFDEATSALDSISEQKIQEAIDPIIRSHTSILIAHRLSTILAADEILVVKDGQIVERGRHQELVNAGGVYQELYETQFSKALAPAGAQGDEPAGDLEQLLWGMQPGDEPG
ncbi:MAG: ABC transporter ATP-binding protein [Clostridia bacterium]|nr:ABC transporter ATP-binding protein [Clostridia bacterium]MBQ6722510.1 ABC transporter ATP-binding protein [Clostridia bacterium]